MKRRCYKHEKKNEKELRAMTYVWEIKAKGEFLVQPLASVHVSKCWWFLVGLDGKVVAFVGHLFAGIGQQQADRLSVLF